MTHTASATWSGGAVEYLGSLVRPPSPRPGQMVTAAHYFRATRALPAGYELFVHLVEPLSGAMVGNADHPLMGGQLPMERWPQGKVVEDVHRFASPEVAGTVQLRLGFWRGDERLPVDLPTAHDGAHRAFGPTLGAGGPPLPEYRAVKLATPPALDGHLTDDAWRSTARAELRGSFDAAAPRQQATMRIGYDASALYVAFEANDDELVATHAKRDEPIYTEEAFEIFLDADANGATYNEMQVSPRNVVFDAYFPARRQGMDLTFDAQMTTAVQVRGTLNDASDRDQGWSAELKIPFSALHAVPRVPPRPGDRWRFNAYWLDVSRGQQAGNSFSPLYVGDFHYLPRFGWLTFE